jgi:hypothetical protein
LSVFLLLQEAKKTMSKYTAAATNLGLALCGTLLVAAQSVQAGEQIDLAWPEFDGNKTEIYYNQYVDGQWQGKAQVTNNEFNNLHPDMAVIDGTVWMVWTALDGLNNKLYYAAKSDGRWGYPKEIETGLKSSIGPKITLVGTTPWITWAGYNGVADDVYVSKWTGSEWTAPEQVNPANEVPDILPEIEVNDSGRLQVTWQAYDGDIYQYYVSERISGTWSEPVQLAEAPAKSSATEKLAEKNISFPDDFAPVELNENVYNLLVR